MFFSVIISTLVICLSTFASQLSSGQVADFSVSGDARQVLSLPCVVGKQTNCGAPYIIAWYKWTASAKLWQRLDLTSSSSLNQLANNSSVAQTNSRFVFDWPPGTLRNCPFSALRTSQTLSSSSSSTSSSSSSSSLSLSRHSVDCLALDVRSALVADEGLYKCEVTYAETLDFDKCPSTTLSQLNIFGKFPLLAPKKKANLLFLSIASRLCFVLLVIASSFCFCFCFYHVT